EQSARADGHAVDDVLGRTGIEVVQSARTGAIVFGEILTVPVVRSRSVVRRSSGNRGCGRLRDLAILEERLSGEEHVVDDDLRVRGRQTGNCVDHLETRRGPGEQEG